MKRDAIMFAFGAVVCWIGLWASLPERGKIDNRDHIVIVPPVDRPCRIDLQRIPTGTTIECGQNRTGQ